MLSDRPRHGEAAVGKVNAVPFGSLSTVLRDNGVARGCRTSRQWIEGQPSGWPARASRTVSRGSHPKGRSAAEDPLSGLTAVVDRAW